MLMEPVGPPINNVVCELFAQYFESIDSKEGENGSGNGEKDDGSEGSTSDVSQHSPTTISTISRIECRVSYFTAKQYVHLIKSLLLRTLQEAILWYRRSCNRCCWSWRLGIENIFVRMRGSLSVIEMKSQLHV